MGIDGNEWTFANGNGILRKGYCARFMFLNHQTEKKKNKKGDRTEKLSGIL